MNPPKDDTDVCVYDKHINYVSFNWWHERECTTILSNFYIKKKFFWFEFSTIYKSQLFLPGVNMKHCQYQIE